MEARRGAAVDSLKLCFNLMKLLIPKLFHQRTVNEQEAEIVILKVSTYFWIKIVPSTSFFMLVSSLSLNVVPWNPTNSLAMATRLIIWASRYPGSFISPILFHPNPDKQHWSNPSRDVRLKQNKLGNWCLYHCSVRHPLYLLSRPYILKLGSFFRSNSDSTPLFHCFPTSLAFNTNH